MKNVLVGFLACSVLAGCGSALMGENKRDQKDGAAEPADLTELQSKPPTEVASLISAYAYQPTSTVAGFVGFYSGSRYLSGAIQLISNNVYRMEASSGHYLQNGEVIDTTPKKITCPGVTPAGTISGSDHGASVVVTVRSVTTVLPKLTVTDAPAGGLVIQWGCFDQITGAFTEHAWTDIP